VFSPHDELRAVSISDLENTIAKAVSDKTGVKINCRIGRIDFENLHSVNATISFSTPTIFDVEREEESGGT
jgi:hypothetical protein